MQEELLSRHSRICWIIECRRKTKKDWKWLQAGLLHFMNMIIINDSNVRLQDVLLRSFASSMFYLLFYALLYCKDIELDKANVWSFAKVYYHQKILSLILCRKLLKCVI